MQIENALILRDDNTVTKGTLCTRDALMADSSLDGEHLDAGGLLALPGFVDIHFHGAMGHDFMDADSDTIAAIAAYEASCGVTSICPASMTMSYEDIMKALDSAKSFRARDNEASLEGVYLEGPFISRKKVGAQNPDFVRSCDDAFADLLLKKYGSLVKIIALAPENEGALAFVDKYKQFFDFSLAHSAATYEEAHRAFESGVIELTHTFNAMNPIHNRAPGPVCAALDFDGIRCELICDGIHIHKGAVKLIFKAFDRVVMISDSMEATGLEDGEYALGGQKVMVKGPLATLQDGTIAGSVSNLYECFKTAVLRMGIPRIAALKACTINPARAIHIENRVGSLDSGKRADILLVDDKTLEIRRIILRGKLLF